MKYIYYSSATNVKELFIFETGRYPHSIYFLNQGDESISILLSLIDLQVVFILHSEIILFLKGTEVTKIWVRISTNILFILTKREAFNF